MPFLAIALFIWSFLYFIIYDRRSNHFSSLIFIVAATSNETNRPKWSAYGISDSLVKWTFLGGCLLVWFNLYSGDLFMFVLRGFFYFILWTHMFKVASQWWTSYFKMFVLKTFFLFFVCDSSHFILFFKIKEKNKNKTLNHSKNENKESTNQGCVFRVRLLNREMLGTLIVGGCNTGIPRHD